MISSISFFLLSKLYSPPKNSSGLLLRKSVSDLIFGEKCKIKKWLQEKQDSGLHARCKAPFYRTSLCELNTFKSSLIASAQNPKKFSYTLLAYSQSNKENNFQQFLDCIKRSWLSHHFHLSRTTNVLQASCIIMDSWKKVLDFYYFLLGIKILPFIL